VGERNRFMGRRDHATDAGRDRLANIGPIVA